MKTCIKALAFVSLCLLSGELSLRVAAVLWAPASVFVAHHRVHDERLGWRLNPDYPDVDRWGFRNANIPLQADVVIFGDSQTYGYGVAPELSWPRQLETRTGLSTYNIACSGYGPVHGLAIWEDVISLKPRIVVATVYAGNDLFDTFQLVYGFGQLPRLRSSDEALQARLTDLEATAPLAARARNVTRMGQPAWPLRDVLRDHSALFHFARQLGAGSAALGGRQDGSWEAAQQRARRHADYLYAHDGGDGARTTLTVSKRLLPQDTADPRIDEGLRMTARALREMSRRSAAAGARFVVVWIPTKELVFAPGIATDTLPGLQRLIEVETHFQRQVRATTVDLGVPFVDALPALQVSLEVGEVPYPETADGHPNATGYARIAGMVVADLPALGGPQGR